MKDPAPVRIDCEGLSTKYINQLADDLDMLYQDVEIAGERIIARKPFCGRYLQSTYQLCEQYGACVEDLK